MFQALYAEAAGDKPHWSYGGKTGPEHWAELATEYANCRKTQQSPIDLVASHAADNENISLRWRQTTATVLNNGHSIQANFPAGSVTRFGDDTFRLLQVHFHHHSEHSISGRHSPMEAHFVHVGGDGSLLVFGVMIEVGDNNPEIAKIWLVAPQQEGEMPTKDIIDAAQLVPAHANYYRYEGSLTTTPCTQSVHWVVFADPIQASQQQIDAFAELYPGNF